MSTFSNKRITTREGRSTNSEFQFETTIDEQEDLFGLTGEEEIENQSCSM
jgi:hypothetical protein